MTISHSETAQFCRGLSVLLHAGISLTEGVYLLAEEQSGTYREALDAVGRCMDQGESLSSAMAQSGAFPGHAAGMLRIGEETGWLEETLDSLALFYEERCRTNRQIKNALAYPSMIFLLMLAVVGVLLVKVLPVFDQVYASLGTGLTGIAAGLLHMGQMLENFLPALLIVLILGCVVAAAFCGIPRFREMVAGWVVRNFGDKGVARKFNNARFARGLSMGLSSGLSLEEALPLARNLLEDIPGACSRCSQCADALEQGIDLSEAMGAAAFLSPAQSRMLSVGLRGGNADRVMEDIADKLMEEARESLEHMVSRIEPTMVLLTSLLVGVILLAVMLPLVNIMSTIG